MKFVKKLAVRSKSFSPTWRYIHNLVPTLSYMKNHDSLKGEQARLLDELNREGVARSSVQALLGPESCFDELLSEVAKLQHELADEIDRQRRAADDQSVKGKSFYLSLLGDQPVLEPESVYARFAIQDGILNVANAYFGMLTKLHYYNIWQTFPTQLEPRQSQLWHRDPADLHIFKLFLHLSDVDEGAGPFTYARGTHMKARLPREPDHFLQRGVKRTSDAQMAEVVPEDRWFKAVGPAGTVILADTRGYHKGGFARERDRLLYMCRFTSSSAKKTGESFAARSPGSAPTSREQAFALAN